MSDDTQPPPFNVGRRQPTAPATETLTLRDQFAMAALQHDMCNCLNSKDAAEIAYLIADAMLEARKEKK